MASVVDICNLALSRLGDTANISSIDPPEGSIQADHCARFYPLARDSLLEMHAWGFATKRQTLAALTPETDAWLFAYALPSDCLRVLAIQHYQSPSDAGLSFVNDGFPDTGIYIPQPFVLETLSSGTKVILTDQQEAACRYVAFITDSSKFSPLFTDALSWLLASYLAGTVIKGDIGIKMAQSCAAMAQAMIAKAVDSDTNQRSGKPVHNVLWMSRR